MKLTIHLVGQAILPAAAFQAAFRKRRLKAGGSQDWLPHFLVILTICTTFLCVAQDPSALLQDSTVKAALESARPSRGAKRRLHRFQCSDEQEYPSHHHQRRWRGNGRAFIERNLRYNQLLERHAARAVARDRAGEMSNKKTAPSGHGSESTCTRFQPHSEPRPQGAVPAVH
jgi:hypothetical protein